jgi:hypothetical protein
MQIAGITRMYAADVKVCHLRNIPQLLTSADRSM